MKSNYTILIFNLLCFISFNALSQININESFESGVPADWTSGAAGFFASPTQSCSGQSARANIWSNNGGSFLSTPNQAAISNATDLNISFQYKLVDWSAATNPTATGWGSLNVEYSIDAGANWVVVDTIDDSNHITSNTCEVKNYTIPAADLPMGSDFQLRFNINWTGGDYYLYLDDVIAVQSTSTPPLCDSVLTTPADGQVDVDIDTNLSWTSATGIPTDYILSVGTTPGGTDVVANVNTGISPSYNFSSDLAYSTTYYVNILPLNANGTADATTCQEFTFTTVADPNVIVDCTAGPVNTTFCYGNNEELTYSFASSDGSSLNLIFNSGFVEGFFDDLIVFDSDGTILFDGDEDLTGLQFQSSGSSISVFLDSDGSINCQQNGYDPIDFDVSCATCTNPQINFSLVDDCVNAPQFFVEADVIDLGSATDLDITDNQGNPAQTVSAAGVVSFGPYPNGTIVELNALNNQDANCQINSPEFTQEFCLNNIVDCTVGPVSFNYCYTNNEFLVLTYQSSDGNSLNLDVASGFLESCCDDFIVQDSDGTEIFNSGGNISGTSVQSTGDSLTVIIDSDGSISCQSSGYDPIDFTVTCATCANPQVSYDIVSNCDSGNDEFFVDVNILDLGSATSLDITNNQGDALQNVSAQTTLTYGPYPNGTGVVFTVENVDDVNCIVTSNSLTQNACPPDNNICDDAEVITVNSGNFCETIFPGTLAAATGSSVPVSCGGPVVQDVWYEFVATAETINSAILFDGFSFPSHAIYADDCGNLTELYCSEEFDDNFDSPSIVAENLTIGDTYKIRVFSDAETNQNFDICLTAPQFGDDNTSCDISIPFCSPTDSDGNPEPLIIPNGYFYLQENVAEDGPDYGCLFTQPNPAWYYLQVQDSGNLEFTIIQNTAYDVDGNPIGDELDVDFIAYGPFTDEDSCDDLTEANTVDCSYSASATEDLSIPNAQEGEIYVVLITNFNQSPGYISFGQTNTGDDAGSTNCNIVFQDEFTACIGDNVILASNNENADQYQWLVFDEASETFVSLDGETSQTLTVTEAGIYQILSLNGTVVNSEEYTVNFMPEPEHNLPEQASICGTDALILDATVLNPDDYDSHEHQWFLNGDPLSGETQATLQITEAGLYSVEITALLENADINGQDLVCSHNFEVQVDSADFTVNLGENQQICPGDETMVYTITANVAGADDTNAEYLWSTDETTQSINVTESGIYEVSVTIDGCPVTESILYTFADEPVFDLGEDQNLCEGETLTLDASVGNSEQFNEVSYAWSDQNGVIEGETLSTLQISTQGFYSVEITTNTLTQDGNLFTCTTSDSININGAVFSVNLGENLTFCDAQPQTIIANVVNEDATNAEYLWSTGETTQSITVSETGVYEVTVTIDGCPVTESVEYTFNESPVVVLGPDTETCDLTMFPIDATPSNIGDNNVTYQWSLNGEPLENDAATLNPDDFGFGTYQVNVFFNEIEDCNTTETITFSIRNISVSLVSDDIDNLFCLNETVTFSASLEGAQIEEADFEWFINGQNQNEASAVLENYEITSSSQNQVVRVEVSIGTECFVFEEQTFSLYDIENCVISEGISPNEDGFNDSLDLRFLDDRSNILSFKVFNRYGQQVYEKLDYRNEFIGQSDNGNMLQTGTYFYVIEFENEDPQYGRVHKGWIYINREQ